MPHEIRQLLLALICEDREEIRTVRSSISAYSATFLSAILGTLAASRGDNAILSTPQATCLAIGFMVVYLGVALVRYRDLRGTRKALNRRETLLLGTDDPTKQEYSKDLVKLLYKEPQDYKIEKHLEQQVDDGQYRIMIVTTVIVSVVLIVIAAMIRRGGA